VIELCLALFPWAPNKKGHAAIKLHTLLDLNGQIPTFLHVSNARESDVAILDHLPMLPGAFYVMDRGYIHFKRLYRFVEAQSFFVIRSKRKMCFQRTSSRVVDKATGLRSDQIIRLTGVASAKDYPVVLRKVRYFDRETGKSFVFLTNHFQLEAIDITLIYKSRWQIELFFKWIKQHLRIKAFYGTSPNAVKVQIWIAVCVYLLLAILKKEHRLEADLHKILQVASLTVFEKIPILEAFDSIDSHSSDSDAAKQLILFE
jgi:IS4 transposase